ncbi:DEAD/DEAH box helicase [Mariniluteicoccus endophyticus]
MDPLNEGLYDSLMTQRLAEQIQATGLEVRRSRLDAAEEPEVLARHLSDVVLRVLRDEESSDRRRAILNELLQNLQADSDKIDASERLVALTRPARPGAEVFYTAAPHTPLSDAALLTNSAGEPSVGAELRSEMKSADEVDLICAFIRWTGLRTMTEELKALERLGVPFRVITTTYMGATERRAIDALVRDYGAEVRIQYEILRTRLHAKGWLFKRRTGFDTAYVGSSNLSRSALLDGLEWNVRLSSVATPALLHKFRATFETYWNDPSFEPYDPDADAERLDEALRVSGGNVRSGNQLLPRGLTPQPLPFQEEILQRLQAARSDHERHRNLVVAATGTGKTMIAAFDYLRMCSGTRRPSLLFVAHRKEILEQAIRSYRAVLGDPSFGSLYIGGSTPTQWRHLFASIQTLNARELQRLEADSFDVVVIDEFHHAAAASYRRLLELLQPRELLGLTATPERTDGFDVREFFDGRTAAELRLWDALKAELLCPFHYFGINDGTDLRQIQWARGRYTDAELTNLYTGNDARTRVILKELTEKVTDVHTMRALGFCVGVHHARYMAQVFNEQGIPALDVNGDTPADQRAEAVRKLQRGEVSILFTADLFNEGVDIPEVDTVLFLRPTESATVFLQQLGRGLRRTRDKPVLTALDFVGHQHKRFRFDQRFTALTGVSRRALPSHVEEGFPFLPSGCQIVLDRETQETVLRNLRSQLSSRWTALVQELRELGNVSLPQFLEATEAELSDLLRDHSWTEAKRQVGLPMPAVGPQEDKLLRRVSRFAHVDDARRAALYLDLLSDDAPRYQDLNASEQIIARMLFFTLWRDKGGFASFEEGLLSLQHEESFRREASEVIHWAWENSGSSQSRVGSESAGLE